MRILLVDDDCRVTNYLVRGFTENRHVVDVARRGEDCLKALGDHQYDLVILEVMLPGIDGFSVLRRIQEHYPSALSRMKVMFLTAGNSLQNRVHGLKMGADDFLGKPFAFSELQARVQSLMRRGPLENQQQLNRFCISDLCVDIDRQQAWRAQRALSLTCLEFSLLAVLARRPGKVFTRTALESLVWKGAFDSDSNVVDAAIRRLRKKVDDPYPVKLIHTRRGMGYVLEESAPE